MKGLSQVISRNSLQPMGTLKNDKTKWSNKTASDLSDAVFGRANSADFTRHDSDFHNTARTGGSD